MNEGFQVMVYTSDDPIIAKQLEEIGCVAVMPLASLIGSGMGILNPWNLQIIIENAKVPVLVDAGVGTASDAAIAMELGCDGVLMNTAIAAAQDPVLMASAMSKAVEAGRDAYLAGRMPKKLYSAAASSPTERHDRDRSKTKPPRTAEFSSSSTRSLPFRGQEESRPDASMSKEAEVAHRPDPQLRAAAGAHVRGAEARLRPTAVALRHRL